MCAIHYNSIVKWQSVYCTLHSGKYLTFHFYHWHFLGSYVCVCVRHPLCVLLNHCHILTFALLSSSPSTCTLTIEHLNNFVQSQFTWRSGAVFGFATSQADNHGFSWAKNPICSPPSPLSFFVTEFEFPIVVGLLCWLVLRRAPEINTSAITTSPGPGRILTSGSAVLAWCKHDWDALATPNDIVA